MLNTFLYYTHFFMQTSLDDLWHRTTPAQSVGGSKLFNWTPFLVLTYVFYMYKIHSCIQNICIRIKKSFKVQNINYSLV